MDERKKSDDEVEVKYLGGPMDGVTTQLKRPLPYMREAVRPEISPDVFVAESVRDIHHVDKTRYRLHRMMVVKWFYVAEGFESLLGENVP